MISLPHLILGLRPDLRNQHGLDADSGAARLLGWLLVSGTREYAALLEDTSWMQVPIKGGPRHGLSTLQYVTYGMRPDLQAAFPLPRSKAAFLDWFYTHGIEEFPIWRFLTAPEQQRALLSPEPWASRMKSIAESTAAWPPTRIAVGKRPFGVNLIGYAFGQLGIGEDLRMATRALAKARIPFAVVNFPPGADIPQNDRSVETHVRDEGEFAVNLFCMTAEECGRFYAERGASQLLDRYTIGYWPWELGKWPAAWKMMLDLVDEVWVSSQHTFDALKPVCNKPLFLMPMTVELGTVKRFSSPSAARKHFGLPSRAKLFCFSFDLNSSIHRKNPQACVDAFLQAFPVGKTTAAEVGLVIKAHKPAKPHKTWDKLKSLAASDPRIHIIESTLPRSELLALYKACDCFVSLHRAEGFGRGLAEALLLGLHVICTGYSGNVDFCRPPHADLVRYGMINVNKTDYVHTRGQLWADPDVAHAATLMKKFVRTPPARSKRSWLQFSAGVVGDGYNTRLHEIRRIAESVPSPFRQSTI